MATTKLTGLLADLTLRVAFDDYEPSSYAFAELLDGSWGPFDLARFSGRPELVGSHIEVRLHPQPGAAHADFLQLRQHWNEPAELRLKDGTTVKAEFGYIANFDMHFGDEEGGTGEFLLVLYNWIAGNDTEVRAWAAIVEGVAFNVGNLSARVQGQEGQRQFARGSNRNLRLHGRHVWHVVDRRPKASVALIEAMPDKLDRDALGDDFLAMQFVFGAPCTMGFAVGFSAQGAVVAAAGLHLGFRPVKTAAGDGDGPIPDRFDTGARWIPVAFEALAKNMAQPDPPLRIPLSGYLDALTDHVDGAYMKVQVAMEAFCAELPKSGGATTLVKKPNEWLTWVQKNADDIRALATDAEAAEKLIGKAKSAMQLPSTDAVEDGLEHLRLALPKDLLKEIRGRNTSVHRFLMTHKKPRNLRDEGVRLEKVKAVLTAIVMRHVGYGGPIAGWERDQTGWRHSPAWWPAWAAEAAATDSYVCERQQNREPSRKPTYERILSLDGGGTWALIQVHALMDLFADLGPDVTGHQVLKHFDLVVANSGGSIVAAALACGMPLKDIANVFEDDTARRSVFQEKLPEAIGRALPFPRYPTSVKYDGLVQYLGPIAAMSPADWHAEYPWLPHLMFLGFDYDTNRAAFFRSDARSLAASTSSAAPSSATILDAVHASTNAPVLYFDGPTHVPPPDGRRRYWDGAIGGYNNPAMAGVVEALANKATRGNIRVLSIGTGTVRRPRRPLEASPRDQLYVGGEPPGILRDFRKLAASILDDPPDAASFVAHVQLGGQLPRGKAVITNGPVIRMNPTIRPVCQNGRWQWNGAFDEETWLKLAALDMDAVDPADVCLIRRLCDAWLRDKVPNQPIRAGDSLEAEVGHDWYSGAKAAVRKFL